MHEITTLIIGLFATVYIGIGVMFSIHMDRHWPAYNIATDKHYIITWALFILWPLPYIAFIAITTWRVITQPRHADWREDLE